MRLDLVLKQAAVVRRRTVAKTLAENGKIEINGKVSKPSSDVKDGDLLTLHLGKRLLEVKITFIKRGSKDIPTYEIVTNTADDIES